MGFMKIFRRVGKIQRELNKDNPDGKRLKKWVRKIRKSAGDAEVLYFRLLNNRDLEKLTTIVKE